MFFDVDYKGNKHKPVWSTLKIFGKSMRIKIPMTTKICAFLMLAFSFNRQLFYPQPYHLTRQLQQLLTTPSSPLRSRIAFHSQKFVSHDKN